MSSGDDARHEHDALVGIFVGGRSSRMGSPKGRLVGPTGEPLVVALANAARVAGCDACLVGAADAYDDLVPTLARLRDVEGIDGPLAGLLALLDEARARNVRFAIALACDMPFVSADTLRALLAWDDVAPIVAARASDDAPWEPFLARYDVARAAPAIRAAAEDGERSPRRALARCAIARFVPEAEEALRDWDTPDDVARDRTRR